MVCYEIALLPCQLHQCGAIKGFWHVMLIMPALSCDLYSLLSHRSSCLICEEVCLLVGMTTQCYHKDSGMLQALYICCC